MLLDPLDHCGVEYHRLCAVDVVQVLVQSINPSVHHSLPDLLSHVSRHLPKYMAKTVPAGLEPKLVHCLHRLIVRCYLFVRHLPGRIEEFLSLYVKLRQSGIRTAIFRVHLAEREGIPHIQSGATDHHAFAGTHSL